MKKFCVWFGLLMSTAVFTACGTGIKNSSESSNSSVSMQTQKINIEIGTKKSIKMKTVPMRRSMQMIMTI